MVRSIGGNGLSVTENFNDVTEFNNNNQSSNRVAISEREIEMVRSPRFEPGSSAWQAYTMMSESITLMS